MGIISEIAKKVLPYTVGNGAPVYRTNPQTGQRLTFAELAQKANETQNNYGVNPYLAQEQHKFDMNI